MIPLLHKVYAKVHGNYEFIKNEYDRGSFDVYSFFVNQKIEHFSIGPLSNEEFVDLTALARG